METCLMSTKDYPYIFFIPFFLLVVVWQFLKTFGHGSSKNLFFFFSFWQRFYLSRFRRRRIFGYVQRMSPIKISVLPTKKWTFCDSFLFESCSNIFKLSIFHWTQVSLLSFFLFFSFVWQSFDKHCQKL